MLVSADTRDIYIYFGYLNCLLLGPDKLMTVGSFNKSVKRCVMYNKMYFVASKRCEYFNIKSNWKRYVRSYLMIEILYNSTFDKK